MLLEHGASPLRDLVDIQFTKESSSLLFKGFLFFHGIICRDFDVDTFDLVFFLCFCFLH